MSDIYSLITKVEKSKLFLDCNQLKTAKSYFLLHLALDL